MVKNAVFERYRSCEAEPSADKVSKNSGKDLLTHDGWSMTMPSAASPASDKAMARR